MPGYAHSARAATLTPIGEIGTRRGTRAKSSDAQAPELDRLGSDHGRRRCDEVQPGSDRPNVPPLVPSWPTARTPSGLFPGRAPRPAYREPLPARPGAVLVGAGSAALWMLLFGLLGHGARSYCWWSISAGIAAWLAAWILARSGDRGVAAGVAMASGLGVAIAMSVVMIRWIGGDWILW